MYGNTVDRGDIRSLHMLLLFMDGLTFSVIFGIS